MEECQEYDAPYIGFLERPEDEAAKYTVRLRDVHGTNYRTCTNKTQERRGITESGDMRETGGHAQL